MTRKTLAAGLAGAILLGAAGLGADIGADRWMAHRLDDALAQAPVTKASHGAVRYSLWRGRLDIDDLAVETSLPTLPSLRAAHVAASGIGPRYLLGFGAGDVALSGVTAEKLELKRSGIVLSYDTLVLTGLRIDAAALASPAPDVVAGLLAHARLARLEAQDFHEKFGEAEAAIASLTAEALADGKFAMIRAKDAAIIPSPATALMGPRRIDLGEIRIAGFAATAWQRAAGAAVPGDGAMLPIADGVEIARARIADRESTLAIESMAVKGLRADADALSRLGTATGDWSRPFGRIAFDRFEMSTLTTPEARRGGRMSLDHLVIDKVEPGRIEGIALENLAVTLPSGVFRLAGFAAQGIAYAAGDKERAPSFFLRRLHLGTLAVGAKAGAELGVKDLLATMDGNPEAPTAVSLNAAGVTIPATAVPQLLLAGYNELTFDYQVQSRYDIAQGVVDSTQRLVARDAGEVSLSLRLSNLSGGAAPDMSVAMQRLLDARLDRFELRYDDASLVDRLIKLNATLTQRDAETVRQSLLDQLEALRAGFAGKPGLVASLDSALAFLRQPGSINLVLAPPQPVALRALMQMAQSRPEGALETLGFSIH